MLPIVCGLVLALLPFAVSAQLSESFTDGDLTQNPRWQGMDTSFEISGGKLRSRHSRPNSTFYISTASAAALGTQWEFWVHLDLATSAQNYADVYLTAETPQLDAGYFVRIGDVADEVCLYYKDNKGVITRLIDGRDGITLRALHIRVTRTAAGEWTLYTDGVEEGRIRDTTYMLSAWFGVMIKQSTASFFGRHFFDDILIGPLNTAPPHVPGRYDLLVHEIMADPSPSAGLPDAEYIELRNVSGKEINIGGWLLKGRSIHAVLPAYKLLADSMVLIVSSSNASMFPSCISGGSSFSLSNEGEQIVLYDNKGQVIHAVEFNAEWYGGGVRAQGGWSLEMKDVKWPCAGAENFAPGGSPGKINSAAEDIVPALPQLWRVSVVDASNVRLHFTTPLDSAAASHIGQAEAPLFNTVKVRLASPMDTGIIYDLGVNGLKDCNGRELPAFRAGYGLPRAVSPGDLVFSEILFDPPQGAQDFIELYNRSAFPVDLNGLYLARRNEAGEINSIVPLWQTPYLLLPGEYIAFSEDGRSVCRHYACLGRLENVPALPSMPQDEGTVLLLRADGQVIDELSYKSSMHAGVLHDARGVSLEKLWPERISKGAGGWHSAASTAGYATPGYRNSRHAPETAMDGWFRVSPEVISPDNDGQNDLAFISWSLPAPGFTLGITVYDAEGREVRALARNYLAGSAGSLAWDGRKDNGTPAPQGIYVIFIRIFGADGNVKQWKYAVALEN